MNTTYSVLEPVELPPKRPYDEVPYQLDWVDVLPAGDTVSTVDNVVVFDNSDDPSDPTDIAAMHPDAATDDNQYITEQKTKGGTTGTYYQLRFRISSALGYKFERSGLFLVEQR